MQSLAAPGLWTHTNIEKIKNNWPALSLNKFIWDIDKEEPCISACQTLLTNSVWLQANPTVRIVPGNGYYANKLTENLEVIWLDKITLSAEFTCGNGLGINPRSLNMSQVIFVVWKILTETWKEHRRQYDGNETKSWNSSTW